jgi:acetylornithine deacetylase
MHTGSDIRHPMVQKGIPTIGLGPLCGDLSQNGRHDEWVDAEDYLRAVAVAALLAAGVVRALKLQCFAQRHK